MTCEVAVMNKRGIAFAADGAVTLGDGKKIYQTAEKLFSLSASIPVAIMTFGNAVMGVPWETVVKIYARSLRERTFDLLDEYAADFFRFVEGATLLFPVECQKAWGADVIHGFWSALYRGKLQERMAGRTDVCTNDQVTALIEIIQEDHADWANFLRLEGIDDKYGQGIVDAYLDVIDQAESAVFQTMALTPQNVTSDCLFHVRKKMDRSTLAWRSCYRKKGETEPFPSVLCFDVGAITAGKLRYFKVDEGRVSYGGDAMVMPFGQNQTIALIFQGIEPSLRTDLLERIVGLQGDVRAGDKKKTHEKDMRDKASDLLDEISKQHYRPLMQAVAALSRRDLAKMAYSLVNITAFLLRMNVDESETVSEPIDVAVLSKGEGFEWIKHKDLAGKSASLVL